MKLVGELPVGQFVDLGLELDAPLLRAQVMGSGPTVLHVFGQHDSLPMSEGTAVTGRCGLDDRWGDVFVASVAWANLGPETCLGLTEIEFVTRVEQRSHLRVPAVFPVTVEQPGVGLLRCRTENLSVGGMRLRADSEPLCSLGGEVHASIEIGVRRLEVRATVLEADAEGARLQFVVLDPAQEMALQRVVLLRVRTLVDATRQHRIVGQDPSSGCRLLRLCTTGCDGPGHCGDDSANG